MVANPSSVRQLVPHFWSSPTSDLLQQLQNSPLKGLLGFTPIPVPILLALVGITVLYIVTSEVAKHIFYKRTRA